MERTIHGKICGLNEINLDNIFKNVTFYFILLYLLLYILFNFLHGIVKKIERYTYAWFTVQIFRSFTLIDIFPDMIRIRDVSEQSYFLSCGGKKYWDKQKESHIIAIAKFAIIIIID